MQNDKLLPCPFCEGEAEVYEQKHREYASTYYVRCKSCHCKSIERTVKGIVIEQWNTRKPIERILEQLEEFKEEKNDIGSKIRNAEDKRCYGFYELGIDEATDIVRKGGVDNAN